MTKIEQRIRMDHRVAFVSDERSSGDGIWVYLRHGFAYLHEWHQIHEETWTACYRELKSGVKPEGA